MLRRELYRTEACRLVELGSDRAVSWLVENADLLPPSGRALDVACGSGRHALLLGAVGFEVVAIDRDEERIGVLRELATRVDGSIETVQRDLETGDVDFGVAEYDLVVVVNYLHRPLFPVLARALRPGGVLLYETFTMEQAVANGRPRNPDHLLRSDELPGRVGTLELLRQREGEFDGRWISSIVARAPVASR